MTNSSGLLLLLLPVANAYLGPSSTRCELPEGDPASISLDTGRFAAEVTTALEALQRKSRSKRKEAPEDESNADIIILNYGPGKPGVKARRVQDAGVEYTCLLCGTQQKQIASHTRKMHTDVLNKEEFEELQSSLRRYAQYAANVKTKRNRRERDPEGMKKAKRESESKRLVKRKAEYPDAVKGAKKRANDLQRANGKRKFKAEQKYGHIFPCACCHTWKSRDQVVELNPQQMDKIEEKAREYHQTLQVNSLYIYI